MKVFQLHRTLANSLGDPVQIDDLSPAIPDGVRFKKSMRESYIDRAAMTVLQTIQPVLMQNEKFADVIFPNIRQMTTLTGFYDYTVKQHFSYNPDISTIAHFIADIDKYDVFWPISMYAGAQGFAYRIPFIRNMEQSIGLRNQMISQNPDTYAEIVPNMTDSSKLRINIYDFSSILGDHFNQIQLIYIPYPKAIATLAADAEYDFEPLMIPKLISFAIMNAMVESQETENVEKFLMPILGVSNAGN